MNNINKRLLTSLSLLLCALGTQAATITVDGTDGSIDSNDGVCSISEAIINANDDAQTHSDCDAGSGADTINLSADITLTAEYENSYYGRTGTPAISTAIVLDGQGHVLERDGSLGCNNDNTSDIGEFRLLRVMNSGNLALNNSVIRGGCADGTSSADDGGGLLNRGILSLQNSLIDGNQADSGGGIASFGLGSVITTIDNSTFSNNSARNFGGGLSSSEDIGAINNSTFSNNSADFGGGLSVESGTLSAINNSTFSNNSANQGGGLYAGQHSTISAINNSTFSGNTAPNGSAIYISEASINNVQNSIFHDGSNCSSLLAFTFNGSNNMADGTSGTNCPGILATALTTATVGPLADNGCTTPLAEGSCVMTHALLAGSEAIDAGDTNATATDQRGVTANGPRDIGAYELNPLGLCSAALQTDGFNTTVATDTELIEAIECANANGEANGGDTINLSADITLTAEYENDATWGATGTPAISTAIVLNGMGHVLERDDSTYSCAIDFTSDTGEFRILRVTSTGHLTLDNTVVRGGCSDSNGQTNSDGGGIVNEGTLSIVNSAIDNNQSGGYGGGLHSVGGTIQTIENTAFSNNYAQLRGGGLNQLNGTITGITNTTFSNNNATDGGGMYVEDMTISLINNVTFSGNTANFGSAMVNQYAIVSQLQNSLFHDDSSCGYISGFGSTFTGSNNLADGSSGTNCPGILTTSLTASSVGSLADNGCTTPLADGSCVMTHALLANSEALDVAVGGTAADQRGFSVDGTRDIGAYEAQLPVISAPANITQEATGPTTATPSLGSATATDADSDDLALTITNDAAANYALGVHTITWTVTDNHGHEGNDTQTLTVQDTTPPVLTLIGTTPVNLNVGDSYSDAGATATDLVDDDTTLSSNIVVNNPVNTNVVGTYTVTYNVSDNAGNPATQISRTVHVNGNAQIQLSTSSIDFGSVLIGQNDTAVITVTNTGNINLSLNSFSPLTAPFTLSGGSCDPLPMTLTPGNNCTIEVTYNPTTPGNHSTNLSINSNGPSSPTLVELRGNGFAPATPVPTLSQWALMLLLGSVIFSSCLFYRRRFD